MTRIFLDLDVDLNGIVVFAFDDRGRVAENSQFVPTSFYRTRTADAVTFTRSIDQLLDHL